MDTFFNGLLGTTKPAVEDRLRMEQAHQPAAATCQCQALEVSYGLVVQAGAVHRLPGTTKPAVETRLRMEAERRAGR